MSSRPALDNTKRMLEVLNEEEINAVQGVAKAFIMNGSFGAKTEEELFDRIDRSIAEADTGCLEDADSALEATISMLNVMSKSEVKKAFVYTKDVFGVENAQFKPMSEERLLSKLALSRRQISEGKCQDMDEAIDEISKDLGL